MHCIVVSAPLGDDTWRIRRSVEIIGYHQAERRARILIGMYLENRKCLGTENYFDVLHRGPVHCTLSPAWPPPQHADERMAGVTTCLLRELYEEAFEEDSGRLFQVKALTAWDEWRKIDHTSVVSVGEATGVRCDEICPSTRTDTLCDYVPFTTWRLGPFRERCSYLVVLEMQFDGHTYDDLLGRGTEFTVDGPTRVLARIREEDFARLPPNELENWTNRLDAFEKGLLLQGEGYDVVILAPPLADELQLCRWSGVSPAPIQPSNGRRFLTANEEFSIAFRNVATTGGPLDNRAFVQSSR
jgi:hypothetical protein